jgi:nitroreductase
MDALTALQTRRSHALLLDPAPSESELQTILEAAALTPDHGSLRPFRFTLLRGDGREAFGAVLEESYLARCAERGEEPVAAKQTKERTKVNRAPLVIVVGAARQPSPKIPWVDQRDAAVAAAMSILVATHALGYGAMWRTGDSTEDERVKQAVGLGPDDAIVGFIYIGTPRQDRGPVGPKTPDLEGLVTEFLG